MNYNELNNFIKNYLENDKTNSAIMLTGEWGSGKSHYIKNELLPYIEKNEAKKCIIVSLYGIASIEDINKSIYLELRAKMLSKKSEKISAGKLVAKTIVKGVTSFFGVDLSVSENDLRTLYSSVDLTNKLIILEDVERCSIDVTELLGYVNNLVEQDGVKVMLVANENEIYRYDEIEIESEDKKKTKKTVLSTKTLEYLKVKEKTVSDTIFFVGDYVKAIESIMKKFSNKYFDLMLSNKNVLGRIKIVEEIRYGIMLTGDCSYNLRSFMFACQKTSDLLDYVDYDLDLGFVEALFLGVIAFSFKYKKNELLQWTEGDSFTSTKLGTYKYPLYKVAYDYIVLQINNQSSLKLSNLYFIEQREAIVKEKELSEVLQVIYRYYESNEKEVVSAVTSVCEYLEKDDVPCSEYLKLANYLISLKYVVECDELVDKCKEYMIKNITQASKDKKITLLHNSGIELHTEEEQKEFSDLEKTLKNIADSDNRQWYIYDYSIERYEDFYKRISQREDRFLNDRAFLQKIEVDKLLNLIPQLDTVQIARLRSVFMSIYRYSNINEFFMSEKPYLEKLKTGLDKLLKDGVFVDKIKANQIRWFISNLEDFIQALNK